MNNVPMTHHAFSDWPRWLASRWDGDFQHSYRAQKQHRYMNSKFITDRGLWKIGNLREAREKYWWKSGDFDYNTNTLNELSHVIRAALNSNDNRGALDASESILHWGRVAHPATLSWLRSSAYESSLCRKLSEGVEILNNPTPAKLTRFNHIDLMMNSGMTKIFSLADSTNQLIIYDSRVGAALGLLARCYLEQNEIKNVPKELDFLWGQAKGSGNKPGPNRNPSSETLRFGRLFGARADHKHAEVMSRASHLVQDVCRHNGLRTTPRDWEAALFMIGYEVPAQTKVP